MAYLVKVAWKCEVGCNEWSQNVHKFFTSTSPSQSLHSIAKCRS